jgi:hypothetical protein
MSVNPREPPPVNIPADLQEDKQQMGAYRSRSVTPTTSTESESRKLEVPEKI